MNNAAMPQKPLRFRASLAIVFLAIVALFAAACSPSPTETEVPPESIQDDVTGPQRFLTIRFESQALATIYESGQNVGIVREMSAKTSATPVLWQSFQPLESNEVSWGATPQSLFVADLALDNGVRVQPTAQIHAAPRTSYVYKSGELTPSGVANGPFVEVVNGPSSDQNATGLSASGSINDAQVSGPFGISELTKGGTQQLTSTNRIQIFLTTQRESGTVLTEIPSNALLVDLSQSTSATVEFNVETGAFISAS